ncbi:MAG: DUF5123 domain-containing protein [Bacteroidales bacterium]|nr:DUF5123 domain-containing protein [Bacteroidales bacterium]
MKQFIKTKNIVWVLTLAVMFFSLQGCKKELNEDRDLPRIFSPVTRPVAVATPYVTISWDTVQDATEYRIQIFRDSLQFLDENKWRPSDNPSGDWYTTETSITLGPLAGGFRHSALIQAISGDPTKSSKDTRITFNVPNEQIIAAPQPGDVKKGSIIVRFPIGSAVTNLKAFLADDEDEEPTPVEEIELTSDDIDAGMVEIGGLTPGTAYTIQIFNEDVRRGSRDYRTNAGIEGDNVKYLPASANLRAEMQNPANIGMILVLPENWDHTMDPDSGVIRPAGPMTIMGDPDGLRAKINTTGTTPISLRDVGNQGGKLEFNYVEFFRTDGFAAGGGGNGAYIMNMNQAEGVNGGGFTLDTFAFINCTFKGYDRNLFRVQGQPWSVPSSIDYLIVDDCQMNTVGMGNYDYGMVYMDVEQFAIYNIQIMNSTFNRFAGNLIWYANNVRTVEQSTKTITIKNNTFWGIHHNNDSRFIVDLRPTPPAGHTVSVSIENNIFSFVQNVNAAEPNHMFNGVRSTTGVNVSAYDNFETNDWAVRPGTEISATAYPGSALDLFVDPLNGDFRIKDGNFFELPNAANAGDPRWR